MKPYLLLTPGPLTTSETVKEAMMTDWCTWDEDYNLGIVQELRKDLVNIATKKPEEYTSILLQGSGTYCVEAVLGATITPKDKLLICSNGAYGDRMGNIAEYYHLDYDMLAFEETEQVSVEYVDDYLSNNSDITHVAFVHCETTTGILNPIKELSHIVKMHGKKLIVDCMSSFGGIPLDVNELGIDFLISSSNKCIQGVPGFGFIIARRSELKYCKGVARSLSLDIYDQWETMEKGHGKWRFTSPTHVVRAFKQALTELIEEGGVEARYQRYCENHRILVEGMRALGFKTLLEDDIQSPIITSFLYPHEGFDFKTFYYALKNKGFVIYPGKISKADTFRIGNIGDGDTKFINNLLISENSTAPSFILNGANKEAYSMGYNLYQRVNNFTMGVSDTAYPTLVNGNLTEEGVYKWNIDQIGQVGGYATKQAVINAVKSFNPAASPMVNLGEVFVEWMGEDAFGLDQRGVTRNPDKMQMGAYDAVLSN